MSDARPLPPFEPKTRDWNPWKVLAVMAVAVVLLGAVVGLLSDDGDSTRGTSVRDRGFDAQAACHTYVRAMLKAPGTADFEDEAAISGGPTLYTVRGWVDAENSFGASLRSYYSCRVVDAGNGWRLQSLTGLD